MSREALVLLVCCCDFRDRAERLIPSKSLRNAVIRAFPGLFCILRMCAPRRAAAVVRPRGREKSADRRRRILISRLLIIRASVPRWKSPFPAYFKGFPAVSPLIPPYPAFLKYPVSPQSTARSDYSLFYEIYQDQQNYKNGQLAQIPALTGSEVTGSQFKHRYVGTSATDTVYASDLRKCKKASDVASILATAWGSTPAAVISSTASFIFDQMLQSMSSDCYKVTISSITYEVLFSYDNSYYTHCYHQTVKEYKSNGSLIRSKTDYYQAIGG